MGKNKQIIGNTNMDRDAALDAMFGEMTDDTTTITELPSRGKFYEGFQGVEIKPLTYMDEQRILTAKDGNVDLVSKLLEKTVEGVSIDELLSMDKMYLLMKVREVSYGDEYDFSVACPNCSTDVKASINLSEHLNLNHVPEDLEDPRTFKLPKLGVDVTVRFPRSKDEMLLKDGESTYKNIYRFITNLNGNSDPIFISKAVKRMHIQDVKKIITETTKGEYGVDPKFIFECPECSYSETMAIPMDVGFFSVS
jgi:hypothetical protein